MVKLGDTTADQSLVLGDTFIGDFISLLQSLSLLCEALTSEPNLGPASLQSGATKTLIEKILENKDSFLSKITKTI